MSKSFEKKIRENEAAKTKAGKQKRTLIITAVIIGIIVVASIAVLLIRKLGKEDYSVDWEAYGKALAEITEKYDDCDKVILKIGDTEVKKYEYYKLKVLDDYTFNAILEQYEEYITTGAGSTLTDAEKESNRPKMPDDEDIIDGLIETETGYICAVNEGIDMTYEEALEKVTDLYETYRKILLIYPEGDSLYESTKISMQQLKLTAKGMGKTDEEYLKYLAEDSRKSLVIGALESKWQGEFSESDYDGTVDEYIAERYEAARASIVVVRYGLE